ncbi:MAG TPA: hypothetical protein EYP62_02500 [Kiritimatiellae bacterium]|nr:hypothetical protein [Kiritimatiellia bacterium]
MKAVSSAAARCATLLLVIWLPPVGDAGELADSLIATISSSSGRFAVGGIEPQRALRIALGAEELIARMESVLGRRVLPPRMKVMVAITPAGADRRGKIALRRDPAGLRPVIEVTWDWRTSEDDVLEVMGMLVIQQLHRGGGGRSPDEPPWWAGCGLARYVRPQVRLGDYRSVYVAWQDELLPPLADFAASAAPAPGPHLEKSISATLFAWIVQTAGGIPQALDLISGFPADARPDAWLAQILSRGDPRGLEYGWELFVAGTPRFTTGAEETEFLHRQVQSAVRITAAQAGALLGRTFDRDLDLSNLMDLPFEERRLVGAWLSVRLQQSVPARRRGASGVVEHLVKYFSLLRQPCLDRYAASRELLAAGVAPPRAGDGDHGRVPVPAR